MQDWNEFENKNIFTLHAISGLHFAAGDENSQNSDWLKSTNLQEASKC